MKSFVLLFTFFATLWQAANAENWSARLKAEHQWLLESFAPQAQATPEATEATEIVEDEISNTQAAPVREIIVPPKHSQIQDEYEYQPAKRRSR